LPYWIRFPKSHRIIPIEVFIPFFLNTDCTYSADKAKTYAGIGYFTSNHYIKSKYKKEMYHPRTELSFYDHQG